jgi:hypothetical protein
MKLMALFLQNVNMLPATLEVPMVLQFPSHADFCIPNPNLSLVLINSV